MDQKTFAERLATINHQPKAQRNMIDPADLPTEGLSRREKILISLRILGSKGISENDAYSSVFWGLHKIGIYPRPVYYWSLAGLFVFGMLLIVFTFGGILALGFGEGIARGPVAGLYNAGWPGVLVMSLFGGAAFAAIIRIKARSSGIPRWSEIGQ
jgi:uncharacterized protein DUF6404